jgi:transposase
MKYTHFVGIDISRNKLDCAVMNGTKLLYHKEIPNIPQDIAAFVSELKGIPDLTMGRTVFGMEQTGIYTAHLLNNLKRLKTNIVLEDAVHIRSSLGKMRGKYDKLDAMRIGRYLYKNKDCLRLWEQRRVIIDQLAHYSSLRLRLLTMHKAMKVPLNEQRAFLDNDLVTRQDELCNESSIAIKNDIGKVDRAIADTVQSDPRLKRLFEIITSVAYIGAVTAVQIIITTNEYKDITDPKKYACYAGVAPFRKDSGTVQTRAKVSYMANKHVKSLLHICAMSAVANKSELRDYYLRKVEEGKPKMAVLNAIRYKLILRIFACLSQDRLYQKDYVRAITTNI